MGQIFKNLGQFQNSKTKIRNHIIYFRLNDSKFIEFFYLGHRIVIFFNILNIRFFLLEIFIYFRKKNNIIFRAYKMDM